MHRLLLSPALVLGFAALSWMPAATVNAQSAAVTPAVKGQPSTNDTYLQGYLLMVDGDKLRKEKDFVGAYYKYRDARDTFDAVHAGDPSWNAEIIDYRRRKIRESMEEVRKLEIERRAAGGAPSPSGIIGSGKPAAPADPNAPPAEIPDQEEMSVPKTPGTLMEDRMRGLLRHIAQLEKRNEEILKSLGAKEEELRRASRERLDSQDSEKKLKERLIDTQTQLDTADAAEKRKHRELIRRVEELEKAVTMANAKLAETSAERDRMAGELSNALGEIKKLTAEAGSLRKERDQMMALLSADGGSGLGKLKILEENQRLKNELTQAQEKMTALARDKDAGQAEIAALKEQVTSVQESLTAMQQENEDYRQQIAALSGKLTAAQKQLAESGAAGAIPETEAVAENTVLRQIILQQLKQQARRERARQNIMDELTKEGVFTKMKELGVESDNLLRSVNEMAAPVVLDKTQREIISSTQVSKLLTSPDGKELYMVDNSAEGNAAGPEVAPNPAGASDKAGLTPELKAYANAAEENFTAGDFASAENNFRKILVAEPQNVYALINLGVTQLRTGHNEGAAETLLKAMAYKYENDFVHYARGVALLRTGRLEEAAEELDDGLKINDQNAAAWHTRGVIALKTGQRDQARQDFLKAVEIDPRISESHFNLAVMYATMDPVQMETARKHYKLATGAGAARDAGLDKLLGSD